METMADAPHACIQNNTENNIMGWRLPKTLGQLSGLTNYPKTIVIPYFLRLT